MEDLFCVWFNLWKSLKLLELHNYHADSKNSKEKEDWFWSYDWEIKLEAGFILVQRGKNSSHTGHIDQRHKATFLWARRFNLPSSSMLPIAVDMDGQISSFPLSTGLLAQHSVKEKEGAQLLGVQELLDTADYLRKNVLSHSGAAHYRP